MTCFPYLKTQDLVKITKNYKKLARLQSLSNKYVKIYNIIITSTTKDCKTNV